jgi:pyruvate,water dikinase
VSIVVPIAEASRPGVPVVGGKGASLGELALAGVAVPGGFVVTADAFEAFMGQLDRDGELRAAVEALPAGDLAVIGQVAARVRAAVTAWPFMPEAGALIGSAYLGLGESVLGVAVRSSATVEDSAEASFAGLQDTYLGIRGPDAVLDCVRRCWASLYNDESVAYRRRLGLPETTVAMAVVVQRMIAPRAAGVLFTRSPVTGDRSVVAIEGTWGLGSALVSGDVTPDSWVISKVTGEITGRRVAAKAKTHSAAAGVGRVIVSDTLPELRDSPCLTDDEIRALAAVARRVEVHYGAPQDIEWAVTDDPHAPAERRVVLLQSRPETVWAAKEVTPAGAPKPRAADHVLAMFGKPASAEP